MESINFNVALKKIQQEGTLAWEYNPFRNYRIDEDMIFYKDRLYTIKEFTEEFGSLEDIIKDGQWDPNIFSKEFTQPIFYQKGSLVDFDTEELQFDLNHPVQLLPTYSYDNSVDLIINDGNSLPKLINSRFSAEGKNKYQIVDRSGDNDVNIYDRGNQFDVDSSLYKLNTSIPEITFSGASYGGNLKIGNYFFYFKYCDADGNESDFIAESGLVSIFIGDSPKSIHSGFREQNSFKKIQFLIENTDPAYQDLIIYYTKATADIYENASVNAYKILQKFKIKDNTVNQIVITGFEPVAEISMTEINSFLQIYDSAQAQATCQNILFLGNVTQQKKNYDILEQCALSIIPEQNTNEKCQVLKFSNDYQGDINNSYYSPRYIYNKVGYWPDELYRFGVVFIYSNNTLSTVYNVRGRDLSKIIDVDTLKGYDGINKIIYDEYNYKIDFKNKVNSEDLLENAKGVCYIPHCSKMEDVIGIDFKIPNNTFKVLKELKIRGLFFVRQKRLPTTLCQAYTIGVEQLSHTPMLPQVGNTYIWESFVDKEEKSYTYYEDGRKEQEKGFLLSHQFDKHLRKINGHLVDPIGAICPDYDVDSPYLNSLFTGGKFKIHVDAINQYPRSTAIKRLYKVDLKDDLIKDDYYYEAEILGIADNTKLGAIGDYMFSARAGEAEEAHKFEFVEFEHKSDNGGNKVLRGIFGPYLGLVGQQQAGSLVTIKIPQYDKGNMEDYFNIRYSDESKFYAISDRIALNSYKLEQHGDYISFPTCYRGDCYISLFTHRVNRNFTDPTTPTNNLILQPSCWAQNLKYEDDVMVLDDVDKINTGDVNAVNLGMWVTIPIRSSINHSVRSLDGSNPEDIVMYGHEKGFYPYFPCSANTTYKTAESTVYNKGFERGVNERVFIELPRAPYYKETFPTRIAYSNVKVNNFFKNSFRVFEGSNYRDYPITYGSIVKLIEFYGSLICVLEHGIYEIPVNERAIAAKGSGGLAYINTENVLPENPKVISDTFGSQWSDSIIKTPSGIYGVDTIGKKIWKIDNRGQFHLLSDWCIQEFLNNNITLTERELTPIIGVRNVKTHYNNYKHDVIFTFYDDTYGFEENAWSICYNEILEKWITFYSWMPSFSDNIYNQFFSFDRDTSKHIGKLGFSCNKDWDNGIYLDNVIFSRGDNLVGILNSRVPEYEGTNVTTNNDYTLHRDLYNNYNKFSIEGNKLSYKGDYDDYIISLSDITEVTYGGVTYIINKEGEWFEGEQKITDTGLNTQLNKIRRQAWKDKFKEGDKQIVYYLNVKVDTTTEYSGTNASYEEFVGNNNINRQTISKDQEYSIAIIPKEHLPLLSTDFWKHGQSGIIDIIDDVKPTFWYGKQHPFEFEFVVNNTLAMHKIFNNLKIIGNNAEPESFHYEIVGDSYDFSKDKKNMYIRQEATKKLFQYNGTNITYNRNYVELIPQQNPKSTIFPFYYYRKDSINSIEDSYHYRDNLDSRNFASMSGSEIVYYKNLNEYRIWCHAKAHNVETDGILQGNMQYKEDNWYVQINPINLYYINENTWIVPPILLDYNTIPDNIISEGQIDNPLPNDVIVYEGDNKQVKIKDKWVKIRIRYSGEKLAIINAVQTLFTISYS